MKLRIKENSIRLRVVRSELASLQDGAAIHETVRFGPHSSQALHYSLSAASDQSQPVAVSFRTDLGPAHISVTLSARQLLAWAPETEVGVYASLPLDPSSPQSGSLEVSIEKDFACLDRSEEENADTFAHPLAGATC